MSSRPPKLQVLLVEDAIEEVYLVRGFLEKGGLYQVTTSQDGDQAARLIKERAFDLIITDLNLPGMDGYDLIRLIKTSLPKIPILATTGYTATHYLEHAYRAGANHVLTKPIDRDELLKVVGELVGGGAPAAPKAPTVLAIGALPGDVEWGCAGFLLGSRVRGDDVLLLPLKNPGGDAASAERRGAERLGARIILEASGTAENPNANQTLLERIVRETRPYIALIPSLADGNVDRRETHRIARGAVADVPTILGYETATSTADFHPTRFVDMSQQLDKKIEALSGYLARGRADLDPAFIEAAARYWGKHVQFGLAEAFEVLKDEPRPAR
jgi:CheY-like chemotaxis protein